MSEKFLKQFFGGIGILVIVYVPIRYLETKPAILMLIAFPLVGWGLGYLLDNENAR